METVAFFNHKGGVGKTTLLFNVGLALAHSGARVLFVDADAQANLTAIALSERDTEDAYEEECTIADSFAPLVDGSGDLVVVEPVQIREHAWLIPGHIELSAYEEICPNGWTESLAGNARGLRVTTAPARLAERAADMLDADYVLFDVGPNVGALNRNILLACDGFVVPLAPDLFSLKALASVGRSVGNWVDGWRSITENAQRRRHDQIPLPVGLPSPLGYVSQQFATYRQAPAEAYRKWLNQIPRAYRDDVVEPLRRVGVPIPIGTNKIGEVRNLSSLIPIAQRANAAVFELSGSEARGAQYTRAQDTYAMFRAVASEITRRLETVRAEP